MKITVVFAIPRTALILPLELQEGATAGDAMQAAVEQAGMDGVAGLTLGIHGHSVGVNEVLHAGDRVEIYRALEANTKEIRRNRLERQSNKS